MPARSNLSKERSKAAKKRWQKVKDEGEDRLMALPGDLVIKVITIYCEIWVLEQHSRALAGQGEHSILPLLLVNRFIQSQVIKCLASVPGVVRAHAGSIKYTLLYMKSENFPTSFVPAPTPREVDTRRGSSHTVVRATWRRSWQ